VIESGGTLGLGGSVSLTDLGNLVNNGGVVVLSGALNLGGGTLDNTPSGVFSNLVISGGTVFSGTIFAQDGILSLSSATFISINYQGDLAIGESESLTGGSGLTVESGGTPDNDGAATLSSGGAV